jgi:excisionase family DNA binding protein
MLTIEEAATVSGSTEREICRRVEEGEIHFTETGRGRLLICSDSLAGNNIIGQVMQIE